MFSVLFTQNFTVYMKFHSLHDILLFTVIFKSVKLSILIDCCLTGFFLVSLYAFGLFRVALCPRQCGPMSQARNSPLFSYDCSGFPGMIQALGE